MSETNIRPGSIQVAMIVRFALIMGVVIFGLIVFFVLKPERQQPAPDQVAVPMVTIMATGFAIVSFIVRFGVLAGMKPPVSRERLEATSEEDRPGLFIGIFQTRSIVEGALWEGAAFFCIIAYMLEGYPLPLLFAGGLVLCMLATLPTQGRFDNYVYDQTRRITNSFE